MHDGRDALPLVAHVHTCASIEASCVLARWFGITYSDIYRCIENSLRRCGLSATDRGGRKRIVTSQAANARRRLRGPFSSYGPDEIEIRVSAYGSCIATQLGRMEMYLRAGVVILGRVDDE